MLLVIVCVAIAESPVIFVLDSFNEKTSYACSLTSDSIEYLPSNGEFQFGFYLYR